MIGAGYCFDCWPGGPVIPPPCRRCGSTSGYYTGGLCWRCHPRAPQRRDACRDCYAWGATRTLKWLCKGCATWRADHEIRACVSCARLVPVDREGACRLCRKQRTRILGIEGRALAPTISLAHANREGQQLFLADMFRVSASPHAKARRPAASPVTPIGPIRPAAHRQLLLFKWPRDLGAGLRRGLPPVADSELEEALLAFTREHAGIHGWVSATSGPVQRGIRILLATQDTPGAPIYESEVLPISKLGISARGVLDVLAAVGMLEHDRQPAIVRWFTVQIAELPEQMQRELLVWFEVMRNGSNTPPRYRPRADATVTNHFRFALSALQAWAGQHESLREIGREDVLAVLPPSGVARAMMLQGLRSIFRVLKARQLVFVNPTARLSVPKPDQPIPAAIDLDALRALLDSDDPARAALAALLAFHAIRVWQLRELKLTDLHDGRLHLGAQTILLADPVRERVSAYLDYRARRWPNTANAHLFINDQSHGRTRPVTPWWIRKRLGMSPQTIRQDRILDEAHATRGDIRRLCDLFGFSTAGAYRYAATVDALDRGAAAAPDAG
jgi:hypothetical protein